MKSVFLHLGLLALLFWSVCALEIEPPPRPAVPSVEAMAGEWRRTVDGWEPRSRWTTPPPPPPPVIATRLAAVHPLNIAALQVLISAGALLLMSPDQGQD